MSEFTPSFAAVLVAAQKGDGAAFDQLYRTLDRRVAAYARVRGAEDPNGLVNEVFLQVFRKLGDFEGGETQFKAWVFTITRNKLIDEARRQRRRPVETPSDFTEPHVLDAEAADDAAAEALQRVGREELMRLLDALTPEQRDVVVLRVVSDLTIPAIAEILDKPVGAVKALQRRAFGALQRILSQEGVPL